jgi:hypothetical protein
MVNWKKKAKIQNAISALPPAISYFLYYWVQRHFGNLKNNNPVSRLRAGGEMWKHIRSLGINPSEKMFFEVGTGVVPIMPITYWLMGAKATITIDLNPYLKDVLVQETIDYIVENKGKIGDLLFPFLDSDRLNELVKLQKNAKATTQSVFKLCQIIYIAPGNAADIDLEDECIDFYTSYAVFEHVTPNSLRKIIKEGNRITKGNGLFINRIDYSDHFSHSDKEISAINFLQYSDADWNRYAGNRYMYMNRLRHDDFLELFKSEGHRILINQPDVDTHSLDLLNSGEFPLNEKFKGKLIETLAIRGAWLVTQKSG